MLAKIWKKLLLFILIIACLFNIVNKLIKRNSLEKELKTSAEYYSNNLNELQSKNIENVEDSLQRLMK